MKFKPGDLIERVAWGTRSHFVEAYRKLGAKGIIVSLSENKHAAKVFWLDSQASAIEWAHDLDKISTAPPESQPQS